MPFANSFLVSRPSAQEYIPHDTTCQATLSNLCTGSGTQAVGHVFFVAMASNLQSDGLQPMSDGLQPYSDGLQLTKRWPPTAIALIAISWLT